MNRAPVITGLGFVSSIGHSRAEVLRSVRELRHGLAAWQPVAGIELPTKVAGLVRGFAVGDENPAAWTWPAEFDLDPAVVRPMPPSGVYALAAVRQALAEAGLAGVDFSDGNTGLYCASGGSPRLQYQHFKKLEASGWRRAHPHAVVSSVAGALNFHLGAALAIRGACCGFSSACASGSHALGFALDEIRLGRQQRMIVVAAEDLNAESALPFTGMGALSENPDPNTASRPFDRLRDGFVPTGGAVALVVESADSAARRGVRAQAAMLGWGQACDGHHIAMPHPEGRGLENAMRLALRDARLVPLPVGYINAHGTSTPQGDRAEAIAIARVFGRFRPPVSSTKALTGHALSMSGLLEAALCVLALDGEFIPGQAHLDETDCPEIELPRRTVDHLLQIAMNNSSGFGGSNVVHVFSKAQS